MKRSYGQWSPQQQKQEIVQVAPHLVVDKSILSKTNKKIQTKCPNINIHLLVEEKQMPYGLRLVLRKNGKDVSQIKIRVSPHSITIASDTFQVEQRQKKYNSVLRYLVILLASTMRYRSIPMQVIHSNAINWKSAKALFQRHFVPTQIYTNELKVLPITLQILQILQNTQRLKQVMSGDQEEQHKPWLFILMMLDLSSIEKSSMMSSLSRALERMIC